MVTLKYRAAFLQLGTLVGIHRSLWLANHIVLRAVCVKVFWRGGSRHGSHVGGLDDWDIATETTSTVTDPLFVFLISAEHQPVYVHGTHFILFKLDSRESWKSCEGTFDPITVPNLMNQVGFHYSCNITERRGLPHFPPSLPDVEYLWCMADSIREVRSGLSNAGVKHVRQS